MRICIISASRAYFIEASPASTIMDVLKKWRGQQADHASFVVVFKHRAVNTAMTVDSLGFEEDNVLFVSRSGRMREIAPVSVAEYQEFVNSPAPDSWSTRSGRSVIYPKRFMWGN